MTSLIVTQIAEKNQPFQIGTKTMRILLRLSILLMFSSSHAVIWSQSYIWINYNTDNGLPQNSVRDICFDKYGYCWLATEIGAVRFDGKKFELIVENNGVGGRCTRFLKTGDNRICYIDENRSYKKITYQRHGRPKIGNIDHLSLYFSYFGYIPPKSFIDDLEKKYGHFIKSHIKIRGSFLGLKNGPIYLLNQKQFDYFGTDGHYIIDSFFMSDMSQYTLLQNKLLLYESRLKLFSMFQNEKCILKRKPLYDADGNLFKIDRVDLSFIRMNDRLFFFQHKNLYEITYQDGKLLSTLFLENLPCTLPISLAYNATYDLYFVGSLTEGLFIRKPSKFSVLRSIDSDTIHTDNIFYSQSSTGNKIFANGYLLEPGHKAKKLFDQPLKTFISKYSEDEFWVPFFQEYTEGHIKLYNTKKQQFGNIVRYANDEGIRGVFGVDSFKQTYILTNRTLYEVHGTRIKPILASRNQFNTLINYGKDSLIIGTRLGVILFDRLNNKVTQLIRTQAEVRTLHKDQSNNLWIGTYLDGYYIWNQKSGVKKMPLDRINRLQSVHTFYFDPFGYLWMTTNNGLIRAHVKELLDFYNNKIIHTPTYEVFDRKDGFLTDEFNGGCNPSHIVLPNGTVSLPSINGLVLFNPKSFKSKIIHPQVYITKLRSRFGIVDTNRSLCFDKKIRHLEFELSTPHFGNPDEISYEYCTDIQDSFWSDVSQSSITLENLTGGQHTFYVRIRQFPQSIRKIEFQIEKYYYETVWFRALLILISAALFYGFYKYRVLYLERQNEKMKLVVAQQTKQLAQKNQALSDNIIQLQKQESELSSLTAIQEKIITIVLHDMRSPIAALVHAIDGAKSDFIERQYNNAFEKLIKFESSLNKLNNFTESFFNWIYYQRRGLKPTYDSINISHILRELRDLFAKINPNNQFILDDQEINYYTDKEILTVVLRNILDNANKNTTNGIISIKLNLSEKYLDIIIADNGTGITEDTIKNIEQLKQNQPKNLNLKNTGFGYQIIHELLRLIQADITIKHNNPKGTEVTIRLFRL